jgi:hypothetical protein
VEFREAIGMAIPPLILLLVDGSNEVVYGSAWPPSICGMLMANNNHNHVRSATISALTRLADHGKFVPVCYLAIANASMKSSFAK